MTQPVMFVRDTNDLDSHIAHGWTETAYCGARPTMRDIGWTLGTYNTIWSGVTVCSDCRDAYGSQMLAGTVR